MVSCIKPSHQLSATSHQPRATSHQPRATSHQPRATSHQPPATSHQPPTVLVASHLVAELLVAGDWWAVASHQPPLSHPATGGQPHSHQPPRKKCLIWGEVFRNPAPKQLILFVWKTWVVEKISSLLLTPPPPALHYFLSLLLILLPPLFKVTSIMNGP